MKPETSTSELRNVTFKELFDSEILPSGISFKLREDTVDIALQIAEVQDSHIWRKKAMQAFILCKQVGSVDLHPDNDDGPGVEFIHNMLDLDVIFISLAWTAQLGGFDIKLSEGVPCPACTNLFHSVPFGDLVIRARDQDKHGEHYVVENIPEKMPNSLKGIPIYVADPTWENARKYVSERSWSNIDVVAMHRTMSSLKAGSTDNVGTHRAVSVMGEAKKMSMEALDACTQTLEKHIPSIQMHLDLKCSKCKEVCVIPFGEGV